mmetsp:Transcript_74110/g.90980  ORF Transcript_74110/g.90980 Transcript_74110/m.90980 type:complete len:211 (-) Transcript_74110:61-693(-)
MAGEQPKKPVGGAYGQFMAEKRPEFLKACAGKRASEVSKMGGAAWKKLSESEKAPYQTKADEAKKIYEEAMKKFLDAGGEKQKGARALRTEKKKEKEGGKKKEKDPNKPKKPTGGAFGCFLNKNRAEFMKKVPKGSSVTAVSKIASAEWKALSEAKKKVYEDEYKTKKEAYEKALKAYQAEKGAEAAEDDDEEEEAEEVKPSPKKKAKKA